MGPRDLHHVGVAVSDLDAAVARYRELFAAEVEACEELSDQGVRVAAMRVGRRGRVELLSPLAEDTPVGRFLASRGEAMHHLALAVDDIEEELEALRSAGAELIDERPRHGVYGSVAFVHPDSLFGVLTELVQEDG
jgi:methylmalonyl-CoA/ethylmalonyl-CoA epimerase